MTGLSGTDSPVCLSTAIREVPPAWSTPEPEPARHCFAYGPGICIHYETEGNGPVPVLLLHGFAASRTTWDDLRTRFPTGRFNLYLLDLLGFGLSSKPREGACDPIEQAAIVLAFLADRELSRVILVGHSIGGTVALLAALMARRSAWRYLIEGLVLIGAPAWPQPFPRFFRYLKIPLLGSLILNLLPTRLIVTRALESVYFDRSLVDDRHIDRYADCFRGSETINALVRSARQLVPEKWEEYCAEYPRLDTPLLLIRGSHDRVVKPWQGERLRDTVPGARLAVIERCGHNPHEEQPGETWRLIERFLEERCPVQ